MSAAPWLVLASASPRRLELLAQVGVVAEVQPADIVEVPEEREGPRAFAERMAREKAAHVLADLARHGDGRWVLAADTVVTVEGESLGKPESDADAAAMLARLAGRSHEVVTAVALARAQAPLHVSSVVTEVTFLPLSTTQIQAYVASGEGRDKAGAYGIQGLGAGLVEGIRGCYFNVVGLPLSHTLSCLRALGAMESWP